MSQKEDELKQALQRQMGLPPGHPTDSELRAIIREMAIIRAVRTPTRADWLKACQQHVPGAGTYGTRAEDQSDLNGLLDQLLNS